MTLVEIPDFDPVFGVGDAIRGADHELVSVMGADQRTQTWFTSIASIGAVRTIIDAYDPMPALRAPLLAQITDIYSTKIGFGYCHHDAHVFQLGPDRLGSTGTSNLSAIASLCQAAVAGDSTAWPDGSFIRDANNVNVVYSAPAALAVCRGAGRYVSDLRATVWTFQGRINAAPDYTALAMIDLTKGWP